jgi:ketosteroid isomerase-like protein
MPTMDELEKRIRELEDKDAIKEMHREYLFYISNLEIDRALDCFSDDIVVEIAHYGTREGIEEVKVFFKEIIKKNVSGSKEGHFTGQPVISVDGDRAKGHWMFYRFVPGPSPVRWIQGRYDCEYIREKDQWKFRRLELTRPWPAFFGSDR